MTSRKDQIVLSYEDSLLRESDLKLLDRGNWLNDNLISFWFTYLTNTLTPKNCGDFSWLSPEIAQLIKSAQHSKEMQHELKAILKDGNHLEKRVLFIPLNDCDYTAHGGWCSISKSFKFFYNSIELSADLFELSGNLLRLPSNRSFFHQVTIGRCSSIAEANRNAPSSSITTVRMATILRQPVSNIETLWSLLLILSWTSS